MYSENVKKLHWLLILMLVNSLLIIERNQIVIIQQKSMYHQEINHYRVKDRVMGWDMQLNILIFVLSQDMDQ